MSPPDEDAEVYVARLERDRTAKDEFFATDPRTPIPDGALESFEGLDYFPPDPAYRFVLDLHAHDDPETIVVETTAEGEREYRRWGEFRFAVADQPCTLQAYRADPGEARLWVPFRDWTNEEETYGAGRYLDLEADRHRTDDGAWVLDFNEAYNPYCAYSPRYECPLIPMENWLALRIEAGERRYPG